jgi:hypothetical protein
MVNYEAMRGRCCVLSVCVAVKTPADIFLAIFLNLLRFFPRVAWEGAGWGPSSLYSEPNTPTNTDRALTVQVHKIILTVQVHKILLYSQISNALQPWCYLSRVTGQDESTQNPTFMYFM